MKHNLNKKGFYDLAAAVIKCGQQDQGFLTYLGEFVPEGAYAKTVGWYLARSEFGSEWAGGNCPTLAESHAVLMAARDYAESAVAEEGFAGNCLEAIEAAIACSPAIEHYEDFKDVAAQLERYTKYGFNAPEATSEATKPDRVGYRFSDKSVLVSGLDYSEELKIKAYRYRPAANTEGLNTPDSDEYEVPLYVGNPFEGAEKKYLLSVGDVAALQRMGSPLASDPDFRRFVLANQDPSSAIRYLKALTYAEWKGVLDPLRYGGPERSNLLRDYADATAHAADMVVNYACHTAKVRDAQFAHVVPDLQQRRRVRAAFAQFAAEHPDTDGTTDGVYDEPALLCLAQHYLEHLFASEGLIRIGKKGGAA